MHDGLGNTGEFENMVAKNILPPGHDNTRKYGYVMINEEALLDLWNQKGRRLFTDQMSAGFRRALDLIHDMIPPDLEWGVQSSPETTVFCTSTENYYIGTVDSEEISLEEYTGYEVK